MEPPNKKRLTLYNNDWEKDSEFKEWLSKKNESTASCILCNSNIAIQYEGRRALTVSKNVML